MRKKVSFSSSSLKIFFWSVLRQVNFFNKEDGKKILLLDCMEKKVTLYQQPLCTCTFKYRWPNCARYYILHEPWGVSVISEVDLLKGSLTFFSKSSPLWPAGACPRWIFFTASDHLISSISHCLPGHTKPKQRQTPLESSGLPGFHQSRRESPLFFPPSCRKLWQVRESSRVS